MFLLFIGSRFPALAADMGPGDVGISQLTSSISVCWCSTKTTKTSALLLLLVIVVIGAKATEACRAKRHLEDECSVAEVR